MNRDQWHRKMRREIELFSYTGATGEDASKMAVAGQRVGAEGGRVTASDQKRTAGSRSAGPKEREFAMAQTKKYSACCEWDLSIKTKKP